MTTNKIGILGGGQLGKMLCQAASPLGVRLHILEKDHSFPAAAVCPDLTLGNFKSEEDVYQFGKHMDIITVEIEAVNTAALHRLEKEGKKVYPQPTVLDTIKDKGLQKQFYQNHNLPTSHFQLFTDADEVRRAVALGKWTIPFVQKSRTDGYDGQGVKVIRSEADLDHLMDVPCLLENLVDIKAEVAVIVARSTHGEVKTHPAVEMEFHPTANLVEYLFSPSNQTKEVEEKAKNIAVAIAEKMGIIGLLAVELFVTHDNEILINEVAPRPHNSGHHTIEGNITSQYEQHLRAILGWPLGDTSATGAAAMINLLGEDSPAGTTKIENIEECLSVSGAHLHIYGKPTCKPFRKMGHATVIDKDVPSAAEKAKYIKDTLKISGNG